MGLVDERRGNSFVMSVEFLRGRNGSASPLRAYEEAWLVPRCFEPMTTFDPSRPCLVHDHLKNNQTFRWKPEWTASYMEYGALDQNGFRVGTA